MPYPGLFGPGGISKHCWTFFGGKWELLDKYCPILGFSYERSYEEPLSREISGLSGTRPTRPDWTPTPTSAMLKTPVYGDCIGFIWDPSEWTTIIGLMPSEMDYYYGLDARSLDHGAHAATGGWKNCFGM